MRKKKEGVEYLPTTGVRTDLKRFMNNYLEYNTVRYEEFVEVWRDQKMVYLCAGRATDREAREFLERVLLIAQEYFLPPYQFQVRVGGLYMLYAIYQIQPLSPKVKIRLTPCQWQDSVFFQQQAAQQNHLDVVYIFQRLLQEQAFLFCYTPSEMSIHSVVKETDEMGDDLADSLKEEKTAVTSLFNYESLEKLSYLQDQYQQMKIGLAGPNAVKADKSLDVVLTELVEDIVVLLQSFKEKVSSFSRQGQKPEDREGQEPVEETTGSRRQMLKSLAYSQPRSRTNKHSHTDVTGAFTSPAKTTFSDSGEAGHGTRKLKLSPVTSSTHMLSRSSRLQDTSHSDDSDEDYVPPSAKKMKQQPKQRNQRGTPAEQQLAAYSSAALQPSMNDSPDLQVSMMSMPVIVGPDGETVFSPRKFAQRTKTCRREVLAEQNSGSKEPAQFNQPETRRKTASKLPGSTCMQESGNHKHAGQENCSHASTAASNNHQDESQIQDSISLQAKVAFKFKKPGKNAHANRITGQNVAEESRTACQDAAETKCSSKRRGRPRKSDAIERAEVAKVSEMIVYGNKGSSLNEKKTKYELVMFPTGMMTSSLNVASCSADLASYRTHINNKSLKSGNISQAAEHMTSKVMHTQDISQAVQHMTSKVRHTQDISQAVQHMTSKVRHTQDISEIELFNCKMTKVHKKQIRRKPAASESPTLTEIVVGKEIGKPAAIQSQVVHRQVTDKCSLTPSTQTCTAEASDKCVVAASHSATSDQTSTAVEANHMEGSNPSQPVNILGQENNLNGLLPREKEQYKRQLDEVDTQSLAVSMKRSRTVYNEPVLGERSVHTEQKVTALRKSVVQKTGTSTPHPRAGSVEESNTSQPVKVLKKYNTRDSIIRLKERCQRQVESGDRESVADFVARYVTEGRQAQLIQSVPKSQKSAVVLREPSIKSQKSAVVLREPSIKSQQSDVVLREFVSVPPATTHHSSVSISPKLQSQDGSPHKVSAAKNITVSKDILPPWTTKQRSSSRAPTSQKRKFCPKIQENKKVDPSLVQYRFL